MSIIDNLRKLQSKSAIALNHSGAAAVEFALILPLLILMFFGAVDLANMLLADNKLRAAASGAADLITQDSDGTISQTELTQITSAVTEIMRPMQVDATRFSLIVTDFRVDQTDKTIYIVWSRLLKPGVTPAPSGTLGVGGMEAASCTNGSGNDGTGNTITLPVALSVDSLGKPVTNDIVRVDASYTWTPWFSVIFNAGFNLHASNYFMPRYAVSISPDSSLSPPC